MTTIIRIVIALLMSLFLTSCEFDINLGNFGSGKKGNGKVVNDSRKITQKFTEISAAAGLKVYVTQADKFNIQVEADENVIDLINTTIKNGKLRINTSKNIGAATKNIYVTLPTITKLEGSSGTLLRTKNTINTSELEVDGSSGAVLEIDVVANEIDIEGSSGSTLRLSGSSNEAEIDVSSGSFINANELQTQNCNADASSGGNIKVMVERSLVAEASSGGNISYKGNPNVKTKKSVSGSVHQY